MRPEEIIRRVDRCIQFWLKDGVSDRFPDMLPHMKKIWLKWAKEEEDYRVGNETYGYNSRISIENNMMYISDRWKCAFRLKWIIDGIEAGLI